MLQTTPNIYTLKNKLIYILPLLIVFFISSCNNETKKSTVYFGGNIINPKSKEVKLTKYYGYADTLTTKLDEHNFFLFEIDSLSPGMYIFEHNDEFQYVYLDKGDSLMLRVNTLEFDESLVFTGKGATENNYLITRYLHNENNNINLIKLFALDVDDFNSKIDSIKSIEEKLLSDYNYKGNHFSKNALRWINRMLDYSEYNFKELYPYNNTIILKKNTITKVDSTFYNYRKNIDLNDSTLYDNPYFRTYAYSRMIAMSVDSIIKVVPEEEFLNNMKEYNKLFHKINAHLITSKFKNSNLEDYLLLRYATDLLGGDFNIEELNKLLVPFYQNVTNEHIVDRVNHLFNRYTKLSPGSKAPDFKTFDGKEYKLLSSYFGKPIYLFFRLGEDSYAWDNNFTTEFNKLKKQYPEIQFITIYLDHSNTWKDKMDEIGNNGIQLYADYNTVKSQYLVHYSNSFVLIDSKGNIVDANASLPGSTIIKKELDKLK